MAHNLYIENGEAHMMYVGQLPWHGLGTPLEKPATSAEAIKAAGLDWTVRKAPLYAIDGPGVAHVPRYYGVVPEDRWGKPDCPVFGVVGEDYQPLQNVEAFDFFDSIVGQKVAMYHTAGALGKGEHVWILAKLPGVMEITASDALDKYVLLSTGHDGRTCVRVILTPVRVVCQNTLTIALHSGEEIARAHHTRTMNRQLDVARKKVQSLIKGFDTLQAAFRAMAGYKMSAAAAKAYVDRVFPLPEEPGDRKVPAWITEDRANCVHLFHCGLGNDDPGAKETLWAAYNGITEYVDHWRARGERQHMYAVCLGRGFQIKGRAFDEALGMLGPISAKGLPERKKRKLLDPKTWERDARLVTTATALRQELGGDLFEDHNLFCRRADEALERLGLKLSASDLKLILRAVSWRVETAAPVVDKLLKEEPDALHGRYPLSALGQSEIGNRKSKIQSVTFEPDSDLRDTEQIPLLEPGGIEAFIRREVLPYTPDAWIKEDATKIGYEISFTRHFYQPQPLRTLEEISADIMAVEKEAEGLLDGLLKGDEK